MVLRRGIEFGVGVGQNLALPLSLSTLMMTSPK